MRCSMCGSKSLTVICTNCTNAMDDELDRKTDHDDPYPDENYSDREEE